MSRDSSINLLSLDLGVRDMNEHIQQMIDWIEHITLFNRLLYRAIYIGGSRNGFR